MEALTPATPRSRPETASSGRQANRPAGRRRASARGLPATDWDQTATASPRAFIASDGSPVLGPGAPSVGPFGESQEGASQVGLVARWAIVRTRKVKVSRSKARIATSALPAPSIATSPPVSGYRPGGAIRWGAPHAPSVPRRAA